MNDPVEHQRIHDIVEALHRDGEFSGDQWTELESILQTDESARETYVLCQELHSMLQLDKSIRLALASDLLPENVVTMPGVEVPDSLVAAPPVEERRRPLEDLQSKQKGGNLQVSFRLMTSLAAMIAGLFVLVGIYQRVGEFSGIPQGQDPTLVSSERIDFRDQVLPILEDNCLECHGEDEDRREADLRLDIPLQNPAKGSPVIVPGEAGESELMARVRSTDPEYRMPPLDRGPGLEKKEIEILRRWIDQGAEFGKNWSRDGKVDRCFLARGLK